MRSCFGLAFTYSHIQSLLVSLFLWFSPARAATWPQGYTGWFAFALSPVVMARICNLFMVPAVTHFLFTKDTVGTLTSTN